MSSSFLNSESTPAIMPNMPLGSYIVLRQCFEGTPEPNILQGYEAFGIREELDAAINSEDMSAKASVLVPPLRLAVSAGARLLKAGGEQSLATSSDFTAKLQNLLRGEYEIATEETRIDTDQIPQFPFEAKILIRTMLRNPYSKRAVEQVRQLLLERG